MVKQSSLHRVRSAAGRSGAKARWANVEREPTVQVRVYDSDAEWLRAQGVTIAEAVRRLRVCDKMRLPGWP